jgi:hypothetical protein
MILLVLTALIRSKILVKFTLPNFSKTIVYYSLQQGGTRKKFTHGFYTIRIHMTYKKD